MSEKVLGNYVTAIDIGTTKICVIIAHVDKKGIVDVLGIGKHPSYGLKKGVVVNINMTVESIKAAIVQAEKITGIKIESACVGISGGHIQSYNSTGVVAIKGRDISQYDIDRVIEAAKAIPIPKDQYILHVLPQYFKVDGQEYVFDSLGMYGVRLEAQVHIITGAIASAQNIIKACELANVGVSDIVLEQLASAEAVLTSHEKKMGIGILDIGGGTADFALYKEGRIRHSKVIPIAGNHFTNDITIGLNIPFENAEQLKKMHGSVALDKIISQENETIEISLGYEGGTKHIKISDLVEILHYRADEIFDILNEEIKTYRLRSMMPAGLVLTGGGSLLGGIQSLAATKFKMPVRIGFPQPSRLANNTCVPDMIKSPIYATGYGLALYAAGQDELDEFRGTKNGIFARVLRRMKSWVYDFF